MKRTFVVFAFAAAAISACFGASSSASVQLAYAPTRAEVTNTVPAALPTQWTVTTAVTATTSTIAATPTTATITTLTTISTNASASQNPHADINFDSAE